MGKEKKGERGEASGLKKKMEKFSFIFLVVLQTKVLESVNVVSKQLQDTNTDIEKAVKLLENTIRILSEYRGSFDQAKTTAQTLSDKWGAQNTFEKVRGRRVKRHFDGLSLVVESGGYSSLQCAGDRKSTRLNSSH